MFEKISSRIRTAALGFALAGLAITASPALPTGRIPFQSYAAAQGLGNLSIWCLEQAPDGFLWVGTEDGLFRYEGLRFQSYGREDGLPSTWVRALCAEPGGRLWIGTTHGLAVREGGRIQALGAADGLPPAEVFALARGEQGRVWVATDRGLFRQRQGHAFEPAPGWPDKALARALHFQDGTLYVTSNSSLLRYGPGATAPAELTGPWKERLDAVLADPAGRLWVRSRSGLWMRPAEGAPWQDLGKGLQAAAYDGALRLAPDGTLLVPTVHGLRRLKGGAVEDLGEAQGLPTPYVNRAMVDREGSLWVGGIGLHRALSREAWRQHTQADGISGGVVRSILKDSHGRMWVGATDGLFQPENGRWKAVPNTLGQAIMALAEAPDGAIWFGGAPGRLRRMVPGRPGWEEFSRPVSTITNIIFDPDGVLWVATRREGLFRVYGAGSGRQVEPVLPPGLDATARVQSMAAGRDGRIWMATTQGLLLLEHGRFTLLGTAQGLLSADLQAVHECPGGELLVSYEDVQGMSRFRYAGGRLAMLDHLDRSTGFRLRKIYFMREDARGRLWVGSSQGVGFFDGVRFQGFRAADGLPGEDCNGTAFLAEPDGGLWVGTLGGMAHFDPARFEGASQPPETRLLAITCGGRALAEPYPSGLKLARRDATVEIRFTGLTYLRESHVLHQIRLVGLENDWVSTDIRQARYANLHPGTYRFEARAGYRDDDWGPVTSFTFTVLPAWYQTWWFRLLGSLGVLGLAALVVRVRIKALHARNQELESLVAARTRDLEEANGVLRQLTVTDPLTGLKNRRFLDLTIESDLAKVERDYQTISRGQTRRMPDNVDIVFLLVDIDHFKRVNDEHGHAAGDQVLQQLRDRLLEATRTTDTVVRWGGEEFLVVARYTDRRLANILADRILDGVRNRPFPVEHGVELNLTISLGFCPFPVAPLEDADITWQQVVATADRCLYAAKRSGRNGWVGTLGLLETPDPAATLMDVPEAGPGSVPCPVVTSFPDPAKLNWM